MVPPTQPHMGRRTLARFAACLCPPVDRAKGFVAFASSDLRFDVAVAMLPALLAQANHLQTEKNHGGFEMRCVVSVPVHPDAFEHLRVEASRLRNEYGGDFWWRPYPSESRVEAIFSQHNVAVLYRVLLIQEYGLQLANLGPGPW